MTTKPCSLLFVFRGDLHTHILPKTYASTRSLIRVKPFSMSTFCFQLIFTAKAFRNLKQEWNKGVGGGKICRGTSRKPNNSVQSSSLALADKGVAWTLASLDPPLLTNARDSLWPEFFGFHVLPLHFLPPLTALFTSYVTIRVCLPGENARVGGHRR